MENTQNKNIVLLQETLVELMKVEQRLRAEKFALVAEKRRAPVCHNCSNIRRTNSAKDLRSIDCLALFLRGIFRFLAK